MTLARGEIKSISHMSTTGLNSEFSFTEGLRPLLKLTTPISSSVYPYLGGGFNKWFHAFEREFKSSEMQRASSRIWKRVAYCISFIYIYIYIYISHTDEFW